MAALMTTFCPACLTDQPVDTLLACTDYNRARIPARIFCAICGLWLGWDELEPEPVPVPRPMFLAPLAGPTSFGGVAEVAESLWKHIGRLAGGVW
jgi:hypothetical protein